MIGTSGETGTLTSSLEYDAFGNERVESALAEDTHGDFRLHGMWKDLSGLYYVRARVYDAAIGRFTSRDPAWLKARSPESVLPYVFGRNNPIVWRDLDGRFATLIGFSMGQAGLAALNAVTFVGSAALMAYVIVRIDQHINQASDGSPRNDQAQSKQFNDAVREIERQIGRRLTRDEKEQLHRAISKQNLGFHEIVAEGVGMFGRWDAYDDEEEGDGENGER